MGLPGYFREMTTRDEIVVLIVIHQQHANWLGGGGHDSVVARHDRGTDFIRQGKPWQPKSIEGLL
jgi:hypothetical protein